MLLIPPLMHGAAQWGVFNAISTGGWVARAYTVRVVERTVRTERSVTVKVSRQVLRRGAYCTIGRVSAFTG